MKIMKDQELERWQKLNRSNNQGYTLKKGDRIMDMWWRWGVVLAIKFDPNASYENHGSIDVRLDNGEEENYAHYGWQENFRVERKQK